MQRLIALADLSSEDRGRISANAADLVRAVRASSDMHMMEAFLSEYGLSTQEGVALMCLAEALLRVPDAETMDDLIRDKIAPHDWSAHSGESASIFVNASTWALMLTGRVLDDEGEGVEAVLRGLVRRMGEPVIRTAVSRAMREMGEQFVLGRTIEEAMKRGRSMVEKGYTYSYDMLGEGSPHGSRCAALSQGLCGCHCRTEAVFQPGRTSGRTLAFPSSFPRFTRAMRRRRRRRCCR